LDDDFVRVVSLYQWEQYELGGNTDRIEFEMYDSHDGVDWDDLDKASDLVLEGLEKGKTLVHCQAGLNRSGLVAAVTLMKQGKTAQEAIDLLRKTRSPLVLCNQTFVKQLHELQAKMEENA
jgi:protein-tyrosine phosphatase